MSLTSSQRHAERRRRLEEERAERRRLEEEEKRKRMQKKKSSSIPAKWYWKGGIKIGGTPVRKFIYAGSNPKETMVDPSVPEPSLLNPVEAVAESSEGAERLGDYPMYQFLSPEQRRGYIEFLASERDEAEDIGYVFLYLYGFERRLVIDAAKPGEVSDEERDDIIDELLRLHAAFGKRSRSLAHYICMLLLYDGSVFDKLAVQELDTLFDLSNKTNITANKNREMCDNADCMSYLLLARLTEKQMEIPVLDVASAAKGRFLRSSNAAMLGIAQSELYDEKLERLFAERVAFCDMDRLPKPSARSLSSPRNPVYYPSSPMIRKKRTTEITSKIAKNPEDSGIPLKALSDMLVACKKDIDACENVLATSSLRDIDKVSYDALSVCTRTDSPLHAFLATKHGATYVPIDVLDKELRQRFGSAISYTSKGILSASTQQLVAMSAAAQGWQAMLPDVVDGAVSSFWRVDEDSKIVMFERGCAHNKKNGKRCIGPVFGGDETSYSLYIPGAWMEAATLSFVYAWFVSKLPAHFDKSHLTMFLSKYYPSFSSASGNKKNQIAFFFSLLHATYSMKLSTHGIKKCLDMADFGAVQELVFTLCDATFGNLVPEDVLAVLEEIYKKAGHDPSQVLYDYHAGSYHYTKQADTGFAIDEEKFAETMADTMGVQDILASAMEDAAKVDWDDEDADAGAASGVSGDVVSGGIEGVVAGDEGAVDISGGGAAGEENSDDGNGTDMIRDAIEGFFGDTDEKQTQELLDFIINSGWAATSAEAMGVVADINNAAGEEIVEIDGADVYWNA